MLYARFHTYGVDVAVFAYGCGVIGHLTGGRHPFVAELVFAAGRGPFGIERGADAVCVVEAKRIKVGTYAIEDGGSFAGPSAYRSNPDNVSPTGEPLETNTFGQQVTLTGETHYRWDFEVKALFYKDKVELGRIMDERKQQLAKFTSSDQEVEATPGEGQEAENSGVSVSEEKGEADK